MTQTEIQVRLWILKALLASNGAMPESVLKMSIRTAFPGVSFTDQDMSQAIRWCEEQKFIAGANDELLGPVWDLTAKGKIRAQQL